MIKPYKHLNLDLSVINIGALILKNLKESSIMKYDELLNKIINLKGDDSKYIFLQSLMFLFILGKIEYVNNGDLIVLIDNKFSLEESA
jgi:hypothetical protein